MLVHVVKAREGARKRGTFFVAYLSERTSTLVSRRRTETSVSSAPLKRRKKSDFGYVRLQCGELEMCQSVKKVEEDGFARNDNLGVPAL